MKPTLAAVVVVFGGYALWGIDGIVAGAGSFIALAGAYHIGWCHGFDRANKIDRANKRD